MAEAGLVEGIQQALEQAKPRKFTESVEVAINLRDVDLSLPANRIEEFKKTVPGYMLRHKMKAGITGWAQINGWRGNTSLRKRIQYDLDYIENWSLFFDFKIILLTVFKGLRAPNAY